MESQLKVDQHGKAIQADDAAAMNRRQFLKTAGLGLGAAIVLFQLRPSRSHAHALHAVAVDISNNHGHEFVIPLNQLVANGPSTYSIQGRSRHPHIIEITPDVITALQAGQTVTLTSSVDAGHTHGVQISVQ